MRVLPRFSAHPPQEHLAISPPPTFQKESADRFGNRVLHIHHSHIEREFLLRLECHFPQSPFISNEVGSLGVWKMPSRAVPFSPDLGEIARSCRRLSPLERAHALNTFVFESLTYQTHSTDKPANATQIWQQKHGSCADFAHVLLTLSRASGLAARYVAGFGPAPGALHAWVEISIRGTWHPFDPTHGREATGLYWPVAVGRDYYDCPPHRGVFHGQSARLELECELQSGT